MCMFHTRVGHKQKYLKKMLDVNEMAKEDIRMCVSIKRNVN